LPYPLGFVIGIRPLDDLQGAFNPFIFQVATPRSRRCLDGAWHCFIIKDSGKHRPSSLIVYLVSIWPMLAQYRSWRDLNCTPGDWNQCRPHPELRQVHTGLFGHPPPLCGTDHPDGMRISIASLAGHRRSTKKFLLVWWYGIGYLHLGNEGGTTWI